MYSSKSIVGRPPKRFRGLPGERVLMTVYVDGDMKNRIIDAAAGYGMTMAEFIKFSVEKEVARQDLDDEEEA